MHVSLILTLTVASLLLNGVSRLGVEPESNLPSSRPLPLSVEAALERGDVQTAVRTTDAAYRRATRDRSWQSLIEVGDAYHRIAGSPTAPEAATKKARDTYQAALHSARRAKSLDGVLRAAEAFGQLGDADQVERSLDIARTLAGSDAEAVDDVRAAAGRLSDLSR
jgi:hypothetical protein